MNTNFSSRLARHGLVSAAVAALAVPAAVVGLAAPASANAACGVVGSNLDGSAYVRQTAGVAANMRSGSSTSCGITGYADNQNALNYYCFTYNTSGASWTYLKNETDGTYGWVSDSLLPKDAGGVRGSRYYCGF
ncbi:SH3 domain-containing protein [Streptomyces sp. NPDC058464]|uniref:SH3 domain-containing protein n=1 Tax=Streptomyces sp. NPDC058464 TaxID=3346511 RepID=UPI0036558C37